MILADAEVGRSWMCTTSKTVVAGYRSLRLPGKKLRFGAVSEDEETGMGDLGAVTNDEAAGRFELTLEGHTAYATYESVGHSIVFTHTETPPELRGRGVGSALARGALDAARARHLEVVPLCPFIASFIGAHTEYLDLVSVRNRLRLKLESVDE